MRSKKIQQSKSKSQIVTQDLEPTPYYFDPSRREPTPEIVISPDTGLHRWVILNGHVKTPTKFLDTANSKNVINYIVGRALGPIRVLVNL